MPWHATAKASLQNHFDGEMKLEMLARHRLLNKQVHVPAVTAAHLNAAAVSNTAIAPSSSLLPPLSSRRSAGARRVATAARAAAAVTRAVTDAVSLLPPRLGLRYRRAFAHVCVQKTAFVCYERIHLSRKLNSVFQSLTASPAPSGHFKPAGAIHTTHASENPGTSRVRVRHK